MNKYICPKCNGKLEFWQEYVVTKSRDVNPKTGELDAVSYTSKMGKLDTCGLECSVCGFEYYGNPSANKIQYTQLNELFDIIARDKYA